jgi:hypothetical protein
VPRTAALFIVALLGGCQRADIGSAEDLVRQQLKDPDSATFSRETAIVDGPHTTVCGLVNAKNSYGGYVGPRRFYALVDRGEADIEPEEATDETGLPVARIFEIEWDKVGCSLPE